MRRSAALNGAIVVDRREHERFEAPEHEQHLVHVEALHARQHLREPRYEALGVLVLGELGGEQEAGEDQRVPDLGHKTMIHCHFNTSVSLSTVSEKRTHPSFEALP